MRSTHVLRSWYLFLVPLAAAAATMQSPTGTWRAEFDGGAVRFEGARLVGPETPRFGPAEFGGGLLLNGPGDTWQGDPTAAEFLVGGAFTVTAWVSLEAGRRWGGIVGRLEDNGGFEQGWLLGYDDERFTIGISSVGADDGDGRLTYLQGRTPFQRGRWHHVAAVYDGTTIRLFVDGTLDGESKEQQGAVLHADFGRPVLGAYRDKDEHYPLDGRLGRVTIQPRALTPAALAQEARGGGWHDLAPWDDVPFGWLVAPYLTWPAADAISIGCESTEPSSLSLRYRAEGETEWQVHTGTGTRTLHVERVTGLTPDTKYFYQVTLASAAPEDAARAADEPRVVESSVGSFRTAASVGKPFTFVVVGDTQTQGDVARRIADLAQEHRPNLFVLAGDLVDTGTDKSEWTGYFFRHLGPLLANIPLMPVLGNHEQDAQHYYDYMSLPEPERWYAFEYGDAEFFMLDGNRSLAEQSEQLKWLEGALSRSHATWRFAVLHQPPYTSDSDDYGKTAEGPSTRGDMNVRNIVGLLERYDVDVCFSGHVHDYERTFPIRGGAVVPYEEGGVIYVTAAGGGGRLEDFDATNTWFGHKKARRHHMVYVALHGRNLELQAIDEDGRLFDVLTLTKRPPRTR